MTLLVFLLVVGLSTVNGLQDADMLMTQVQSQRVAQRLTG